MSRIKRTTIADVLSADLNARNLALANLAEVARYPLYAEDMYVTTDANPVGDTRFAGWRFVGWLRTTVAANLIGDISHWLFGTVNTTYFGALFQSQDDLNQYLIAVRGTESGPEWVQNCVALPHILQSFKVRIAAALVEKGGVPTKHLSGGTVPSGFHGIYENLTLGSDAASAPDAYVTITHAITTLQREHGAAWQDAEIVVTGHSLGAAVASYLAYDLVTKSAAKTLDLYMFASPMPGDGIYARSFHDLDSKRGNNGTCDLNVLSVVYERDLVPMVPPAYAPMLDTLKIIAPGGTAHGQQYLTTCEIEDTPGGNHHVICYAAMLSDATAMATLCDGRDEDTVSCITDVHARPALAAATYMAAPAWVALYP